MTTPPPDHLRLTRVDTGDRVRIELDGDLDHDTADLLVNEATAQLSARPGLGHLHLHCGGLGMIDSMGLSALLMISRRTTAAGVRLHLEDRPANLDRILRLTGTFDHLTAPSPTGAAGDSAYEEEATVFRPTRPDAGT
ncbi:STAS domain-containing protein [Streptomyces flavotricini]|uniref:STAS domain-containing protein n=1 Tax=Streptomyces flavotricini TaxID=66888 RepID=A0ABS8EHC7_9ACTN|nr:STAS domain-containing protein [Streptomyces flavotricini]MCC0100343.1 STAS domain-containing protein [Streptomyces flavotricini]